MSATVHIYKPTVKGEQTAWVRAMVTVSKMAGTALKGHLDEVLLTQKGITPKALDALKQQLGLQPAELHWIIKPRTLSHRKEKHESLTPEETGRWLRAAKIQALALEVFGNQKKAVAWLHKSRKRFGDQSAIMLIQSEPGAQFVEETLNQIDAGYFA